MFNRKDNKKILLFKDAGDAELNTNNANFILVDRVRLFASLSF